MKLASFAALALSLVCTAGTASGQELHAAHIPRAGGEFRAAAGDRLHVEGVFAEQRRFRLLVWDGFGNPLPVEQLRAIEVRVLAAGAAQDAALIEVDRFFEARIPTLTLPAEIAVELRPSPGAPVERLAFTFAAYSADTLGLSIGAPVEIPSTLAGILDALRANRREAQSAVDRSDFLAVLGPEDRMHDLLLAMDPHVAAIPAARRARIDASRLAAVRAGWLLHTAIDYGNVPQAAAAFTMLSEAIDALGDAMKGVAP